jgi:U6 snRNA-associated Sm-like protein LSm6
LNSGTDYKGVLACLDGYMNIAMEQTEEYVDGQLKAKYGDCFIRGNNGECIQHAFHFVTHIYLFVSFSLTLYIYFQYCTFHLKRKSKFDIVVIKSKHRYESMMIERKDVGQSSRFSIDSYL